LLKTYFIPHIGLLDFLISNYILVPVIFFLVIFHFVHVVDCIDLFLRVTTLQIKWNSLTFPVWQAKVRRYTVLTLWLTVIASH